MAALDTLLDRLVVPGYSKIGYLARSRSWAPLPQRALDGKLCAVTGANSGLGTATAAGLAALGARVLLVVRSRQRGERALEGLRSRHPDAEFELAECDVSDLAGVRAFADEVLARKEGLHALVHNAGVLPAARTETADGHELTLATHVLGPYALTTRLRPALAGGRVIFVSSGGMYAQKLRTDDMEYRVGEYRGAAAYARTKRMQVVLAQVLGERFDDVVVHSMHPGWAATPGVTDSLPTFNTVMGPLLRSPEQGADTAVWLAAAAEPGRRTGLFWHDRQPRPVDYLPATRASAAQRDQLLNYCERATGGE